MASVYRLDANAGYAGWQWLFIVDGVIFLPIALLGYVFIPNQPSTTRAFYLTAEDKLFAQKRMALEGCKPRAPYVSLSANLMILPSKAF